MKIQQLRCFRAVVDNDFNVTAAADALFTSQPGVSKQVRQLEDELGSPLFVRRGRRLESLTPLGEAIADEAGRVLEQVEHIRGLADDFRARAG